jgi:hypothetical protein
LLLFLFKEVGIDAAVVQAAGDKAEAAVAQESFLDRAFGSFLDTFVVRAFDGRQVSFFCGAFRAAPRIQPPYSTPWLRIRNQKGISVRILPTPLR